MYHLLKQKHLMLLRSTCMFKAQLLLHIFMLCYCLQLLLLNTMLYVTHTVLNMYCLLFRSNVNTNW